MAEIICRQKRFRLKREARVGDLATVQKGGL